MWRLLLAIAVAVPAFAPSEPASAQLPTGSAPLRVVPAAPSPCPGQGYFFTGQSVRITGSGFDPSVAIEVYFSVEDGARTLIDTVGADTSGGLDAVVSLPTGLSTPVMAALEAQGAVSKSDLLNLNTMFEFLASGGADGDGDLVPDVCDNCPITMNSGQEDDDLDGLGNVCDPCPMDQANDADGDGSCGDADACPFDPNNDVDGDEICGNVDNCPDTSNPSQLDVDANGIGDACQTNSTCSDGIDNDGDGAVDWDGNSDEFPADPDCAGLGYHDSETVSAPDAMSDGVSPDAKSGP